MSAATGIPPLFIVEISLPGAASEHLTTLVSSRTAEGAQ